LEQQEEESFRRLQRGCKVETDSRLMLARPTG
jgi:hypothetical protein